LGQLQAVLLPAALVKVTIILPRYSEPGRYDVAVARDKDGRDLLAHGNGAASGTGDRKEVSVYLDLRKFRPGSYFLSTPHEQDQASYYYPLQIRSESVELVSGRVTICRNAALNYILV